MQIRDKLIELLSGYYKEYAGGQFVNYLTESEAEELADYLLENGVIVHEFRNTDRTSEELKCCPFCGSTKVVLREGAMFNGAVHCLNCTADVVFDAVRMIKDGDYDWKKAVTLGWNKRAENTSEGGAEE